MILTKALPVILSLVILAGSVYAAEPVIDSNTIQELFSSTEDYCSRMLAIGTQEEKEFFKFYLDTMREKNAVKLAADYETGRVWFVEPMTGIHIMIVPRSYMVVEQELCDRIARTAGEMTRVFFSKSNAFSSPLGAEIMIDLASWTDPCAPRDMINVSFQVKLEKGDDFEIADYSGKARMALRGKSSKGRATAEEQIKRLEAELSELYRQLSEVKKSSSYSKEMAIRRLLKEISDVESILEQLKSGK